MRALFLDDEVEFLELMHKRLTRRGMEVVTAPDGQTALHLLDQAMQEGQTFPGSQPGRQQRGQPARAKIRRGRQEQRGKRAQHKCPGGYDRAERQAHQRAVERRAQQGCQQKQGGVGQEGCAQEKRAECQRDKINGIQRGFWLQVVVQKACNLRFRGAADNQTHTPLLVGRQTVKPIRIGLTGRYIHWNPVSLF